MNTRLLVCFTLAAALFLSFGYRDPSNPPLGNTGGPSETTCQQSGCHGGGAFTANLDITGLPDTLMADSTYALTVQATSNTSARGGFQLTCLDATNTKTGTLLTATGVNIATQTATGRQYARQSTPKNVVAQSVSWVVNWKAPSTAGQARFFYAMLLSNNNGNDNGDNAVKDSLSLPVVVASLAPPTISVQPPAVLNLCQGENISLTIAAQGAAALSYQWYFNGNLIPITTPTLTLTGALPAQSGAYTCQVSYANNQSPVLSQACQVAIAAAATPAITISTPDTEVTTTESVIFTAVAAGVTMSPSYQWFLNGAMVSGANQSTWTSSGWADGDEVTCVLTSTDACVTASTATSAPIILSVITASFDSKLPMISVYPNPVKAGNSLKVAADNASGQYRLFDITGKYSLIGQLTVSDRAVQVPSHWPAGTYHVVVFDSKGKSSQRAWVLVVE
jgi:Immunoglobulin domain